MAGHPRRESAGADLRKKPASAQNREGDSMSNRKLFAMFALGTAFALTAALPAAAADREDKAPRGPRHHEVAPAASSVQAGFSTSGNPSGKLTVQRQHSSKPSDRPSFMEKAECSGSCGDIS